MSRVLEPVGGLLCAMFLLVLPVGLYAHKGDKLSVVSSHDHTGYSVISWSKVQKLTWDHFRGSVPVDAEAITAAATYCGIGFEANALSDTNSNFQVRVYNNFYINDSWARPEEMNDDVLAHEQGHFDLCELYTRKLRERMHQVQIDKQTMRTVLKKIYEDLQEEYQIRQQMYEDETAHGVNLQQQKKWQQILNLELSATEHWCES